MLEFISNIRYTTWFCLLALVVAVINKDKFGFLEKLILVIVGLNVLADLTANLLSMKGVNNSLVYNILTPVEHLLTLLLYKYSSQQSALSNAISVALLAVLSVVLGYYIVDIGVKRFHFEAFLLSGMIVAVFSYLKLRTMIVNGEPLNTLIFWFAIANLFYYALMISSMSALPLANQISLYLAKGVKAVNDLAYVLWSIILTIGILWIPKRST